MAKTKTTKKRKLEASNAEKEDLLSPELRQELAGEETDGNNALILPGTKKKKNKKEMVVTENMKVQAQKISKAKRKKLQQLKEKKEKAEKRAKAYKSLEDNRMKEDHLKLLYSSGSLGGKQTLRERLRRTHGLQKAGVEMTEEQQDELYKPRARDETPEFESLQHVDSNLKSTVPEVTAESWLTKTDTEEKTNDGPPVPAVDEPPNEALMKLMALKEKNAKKRALANKAVAEKNADEPLVNDTSISEAQRYIPEPIEIEKLMRAQTAEKKELVQLTKVVKLNRVPEIQLARMQLPVCNSEQEVMEAITSSPVLILCGETGSGKTTQVPQFLYEAGYGCPDQSPSNPNPNPGMICVTQPRRVAAVSTAKRVAEELNIEFGKDGHVGYQIRYDAEHIGDKTRIKFMTDGILLKEVQTDFLLKKYSIILLDEAHERNVNTDILIGLLSRIVPLRQKLSHEEKAKWEVLSDEERVTAPFPLQPLKLVIMSATLRVGDFTENKKLFPMPPPVLKVDARQYPVTIHFNKKTELDDYVDAAFKKVLRIHRKLPEGGILVFLTGQREIMQLCRKLRKMLKGPHVQATKSENPIRRKGRRGSEDLHEQDDDEDEADLEDAEKYGNEELESEGSDNEKEDSDDEPEERYGPGHVLPLYSLLANDEQLRVFEPPPEGHRLIVVATNVAETSLTIPGIKYVVDAGRTKERVYDEKSGISEFKIQWVSKASANQRAGRAGRTGPGHCYRLFSSAVFDNEFVQFSEPEINCRPIEDVVLQMKAMGIDEIERFPFPTPPNQVAIRTAMQALLHLGALDSDSNRITQLGRILSQYPVAARYAKMLVLARQGTTACLEYTIAIVACLSGQSPFVAVHDRREKQKTEEKKEEDIEADWKEAEELRRHMQWVHQDSDVLGMLRAAGAFAYAGASKTFCDENQLHDKTMQQILKLRHQLTRIVNLMFEEDEAYEKIEVNRKMTPPSAEDESFLRQIITTGFLDNVARLAPVGTIKEGSRLERTCAYISCSATVTEPLYIHPHSHCFTTDKKRLPEFVVYQQVMRTSRAYMKNVTVVSPSWLLHSAMGTSLCKLSSPLENPRPSYNRKTDMLECFVSARYGDLGWELPMSKIPYPEDHEDAYRWFARCILEGSVISSFSSLQNSWVEKPTAIIRKKFDKRVHDLVSSLESRRIFSLVALRAQWQSEPKYLYTPLLAWVKKGQKGLFDQLWKTRMK